MSTTNTAPAPTTPKSGIMLRAMVGIGVFCALLIVLTYEGTLPRVTRLKAEALEKAIFKVVPGITQTRAYQLDANNQFVPANAEDKEAEVVYAGFDDSGELLGVAIAAGEQGYADIIRILYGYDPEQQTVVGFYVLESKETPGLGDKIEKDTNFLANFRALDVSLNDNMSGLNNTVVPVKAGTKENPWEVDGISGATISSKAIGNALGKSTQKWVPLIYQNREVFVLDTTDQGKNAE
jgi:electron transport complex protein RnfG